MYSLTQYIAYKETSSISKYILCICKVCIYCLCLVHLYSPAVQRTCNNTQTTYHCAPDLVTSGPQCCGSGLRFTGSGSDPSEKKNPGDDPVETVGSGPT